MATWCPVATRERPADRGRRNARVALVRLREEIRRARVAAGLSQREVAQAVGVSHAQIGRLERDRIRRPSPDLLGAVCAVVGLRLSLKTYPEGDPIRDRQHTALLERFRRVLHPTLRFRTEIPFPIPGDLRAWDGRVMGTDLLYRVEAETAITDGQALARRLALKARDGGSGRIILLVADTRANREALAALRPLLRDLLPLDTRAVLHALRRGMDPAGNGIVIL